MKNNHNINRFLRFFSAVLLLFTMLNTSNALTLTVMADNIVSAGSNGFIAVIDSKIPKNAIHINNSNIVSINWQQSGKYYVLDEDIYLSNEWSPISEFNGTFDGQGHSINNLYILKTSAKSYAGLFSYIDSGKSIIKNVAVKIGGNNLSSSTSSYSSYHSYAGGLIGYCGDGDKKNTVTIENCYVTGNISAYSPNSNAGGLIGNVYFERSGSKLTIKNCYTASSVTADNSVSNPASDGEPSYHYSTAGGFIGSCDIFNRNAVLIENCYSVSDVRACNTGTVNTYAWDSTAGGFIGIQNGSKSSLTIKNCYSTGNISAYDSISSNAGGLLAVCQSYNKSTILIENCFAAGNISALSSSSSAYSSDFTVSANASAGGLIQDCSVCDNSKITIRNCYSSGNVSSAISAADDLHSSAGGLIDICSVWLNSIIAVENCYSVSNVSASSNADNITDNYVVSTSGGLIGCCYFDYYDEGVKNIIGSISLKNCYAAGTVSASAYVGSVKSQYIYTGGLIGYIFENDDEDYSYDFILTNCYRLSSQAITGDNINTTGTPLSSAQFQNKSSFINWNFSGIWDINAVQNNGYPFLNINDGINYDNITEVIVKGKINGVEKDEYIINLSKETFTVPADYIIKAYSINGGTKWITVKSDEFSAKKFPKFFSKDFSLCISDKELDSKTKKPAENAKIVNFSKINKRPKPPKIAVDYEIRSDLAGITAGKWTLISKDKNADTSNPINKNDIEIVSANSMGKFPSEKSFGKFYTGEKSDIPIKELTDNKIIKSVYFVRFEPKHDGDIYTAASKPIKISVTSEQKALKYKIDSKKNIIKLKKGDTIFAGTYAQLGTNPPVSCNANMALSSGQILLITAPKGVEISVADYTGTIIIWKSATAKKPASAKQILVKSAK